MKAETEKNLRDVLAKVMESVHKETMDDLAKSDVENVLKMAIVVNLAMNTGLLAAELKLAIAFAHGELRKDRESLQAEINGMVNP